jgi:putative transposase
MTMAKRLIRSSICPYHVNARGNNKEWFSVKPHEAWEVFTHLCSKVTTTYVANFHAFVLMPNHFHALLSTPDKNLDQIMNYFMREAAREINYRSDRINHVFGGTYHRGIITSSVHYSHVFKYIYRNPVAANLCKNVEDYPYSTLDPKNNLTMPLGNPKNYFDACTTFERQKLLKWLNTPTQAEHHKQILKALKKSEFKFTRDPKTLRPSKLDFEIS